MVVSGVVQSVSGVSLVYSSVKSFSGDLDELNRCKETAEKEKQNSETNKKSETQKKSPTKGESKIWRDLDNVKGQDRKTSGTGKNKRYYEWDHTHNDIEVYDKKGRHLGSMDPTTGEMYKPAVPGRTIDIN